MARTRRGWWRGSRPPQTSKRPSGTRTTPRGPLYESYEAKRSIYREMVGIARGERILASTSGLLMTEIQKAARGFRGDLSWLIHGTPSNSSHWSRSARAS